MSGKNLISSLKDLCLFLEEWQIDYVLVGGLAVGVWAMPRATVDIDFLVVVDKKDVDNLVAKLEKTGEFLLVNKKVIVFKKITFLRAILDVKPEIIVDFVLADDEFKKNAILRKLTVDFEGRRVNLCTAEDLIILKLLSKREQDILDVKNILSLQGKNLDGRYLRKWIVKLGLKLPSLKG